MNNTITEMDLTGTFPPALTRDPKMMALTKAVAAQLLKTNREIPRNIIYAKIDELQEDVLDVLAYDLHVDWYDYEYPIEAKRGVIKDSVRVHKRLGTVFAVRTALGSVYPESEIEEWFDYGGEHHRFRVVLDVTHARAPAEYSSIKKAIDSYKRLSAQMENLIYQCRVGIRIRTTADGIQYMTGYSGRRFAGTYPQRNTLAALTDAGVAIYAGGGAFRTTSPAAGTKPQRSRTAALQSSVLRTSGAGEPFGFSAPATGRNRAGTTPGRNTDGVIARVEVELSTAAETYRFTSPAAGTKPQRDVTAELQSVVLQASGEGAQFRFTSQASGTAPQISETAEGETGGIIPTVTAEGFAYRFKRCGTSRCKE